MELEMQIQGVDANEQTATGVEDWLRNAHIRGLVIQHRSLPSKPGEMGLQWATVLTAPVVGPVMEGVKSVFKYMEMRRPSVTIKLKAGGIELEIDAKNLKDSDAFLRQLLSVVKAQGT